MKLLKLPEKVPVQLPPEVVAVATVIFTCPVGPANIGITAMEFVKVAFGKGVFENDVDEMPNNRNKINKYLKEFLIFCKGYPLRFFNKKSLLKKAL